MAHITGGGLLENIPRVLPRGCKAVLDSATWTMPPIFSLLQQEGNIPREELYRTFNCGIGMVLVVPEKEAEEILIRLKGLHEDAHVIGTIDKCPAGSECVELL
jgi:phosphoribosylformylglycinamidine cyclo-ligase